MDLSVLLSTRDRAPLLAGVLEHLCRQEGLDGVRWEVLVVDNGSTDGTPDVLARFAQRLPLVALREPRAGKSLALNRALESARGELLVFTDDDVEPVPRWLAEYLAASRRWPDHIVFGGPIRPLYPPEMPGWMRKLADDQPHYAAPAFGHLLLDQEEGQMNMLPFGGNWAVRAQAMSGVRFRVDSGPEGAVGEDTDIMLRLIRDKLLPVYVPAAGLGHVIRADQVQVPALLGRAYRMGRGDLLIFTETVGLPLQSIWKHRLQLLLAKTLYLFASLRGPAARLMAGVGVDYLRGYLFERRRLVARRAAASRPAPATGETEAPRGPAGAASS